MTPSPSPGPRRHRLSVHRLSLVALLVQLLAGGCGPAAHSSAAPGPGAADSLYHAVRPAMGTTAEVYLYAPGTERASALFEAAFAEIERVEAALSTYRATSEVSRINKFAAEGPVTTDPEVFGLLERALALSDHTGGAFDITVASLVKAWGFFREAGHLPSAAEVAEARARTGWRHVRLDPSSRSVRFLAPGLELDFGGIGKGWALDCAARILRDLGVGAALLGIGKSSYYAIGAPPGSSGWPIRVPDPQVPDQVLSTVHLWDESLSTSGSLEKYFELDGQRYSHIFDPRTGRPSVDMMQVTVIAPTATDSDALSTSMFVLGPDGAHGLAAGEGVEVLLVTESPGGGRVVGLEWSSRIFRPDTLTRPLGDEVPATALSELEAR